MHGFLLFLGAGFVLVGMSLALSNLRNVARRKTHSRDGHVTHQPSNWVGPSRSREISCRARKGWSKHP
jgi:hypothetical protein